MTGSCRHSSETVETTESLKRGGKDIGNELALCGSKVAGWWDGGGWCVTVEVGWGCEAYVRTWTNLSLSQPINTNSAYLVATQRTFATTWGQGGEGIY